MRYLPEPSSGLGPADGNCLSVCSSLGILLINLGSPQAPTPRAVRTYLKEFLSDPRVVEYPPLLWQPLLRGIILNVRPRQSARKYQCIWTQDGAPLVVHTARMADLLGERLARRGIRARVGWAMRYGAPKVADELTRLKMAGASHFLILPLYPQYAASTTGSALDAVCHWLSRTRNPPVFRFVRDFHGDPGYLKALEESVRQHWRDHPPGRDCCLLMSFHGLPRKSIAEGDPYEGACLATGKRLAERLDLAPERYRIAFQSRFGPQEWLTPATAETLRALPCEGFSRVDVLCPGFVADCLETLEEIALLGKQEFLRAGGETFHHIPALNERAAWIDALADLVAASAPDWMDAFRAAPGAGIG